MTKVNDVIKSKVIKSLSDNISSSSFTMKIDNYGGKNSNTYTLGQEVQIYSDIGYNPPNTLIFTGILENIEYPTDALDETITLSGRDYTARLQDRVVEPEVYNNLPAGSIVKDIINKYTDDITVNNVNDSPTTISRITFNNTSVYDSIKKLADLAGYSFYIDVNKDLHFFEKSSESSNYTFDSSNVTSSNITDRRDTVFNEIWVYGDSYLDSFKEVFTSDGIGSTINLLYKPHNTQVDIGSPITEAIRQKGGIYNLSTIPASGTNYLVDYNNKQLVWVSGTTLGYNSIPASGETVTVNYQRDLPIIKVGKDNDSIAKYKKRVKIIVDKTIKDPDVAQDRLVYELANSKNPQKEGKLRVRDVINVTPGQTCVVNLPHQNVNNKTYDILEATYDFNKQNNFTGDVLTLKVNKKMPDITDVIKNLVEQVKTIQSQDTSSDILSRYEYTTGSVTILQSGTIVQTRSIAGDTLIWGNENFGIWGTGKWGDSATTGFILGNNQAAILGVSKLGNQTSQFKTVWSGNYY